MAWETSRELGGGGAEWGVSYMGVRTLPKLEGIRSLFLEKNNKQHDDELWTKTMHYCRSPRGDQRSMLVLVGLVIGNRVVGVITRAAYSCSYGLFGLFAASFACGIAREVPTTGVYR